MEWIKVFGSLKEAKKTVPKGSVVPVNIGRHVICLGHVDDGFYAIDDYCPHEGASLAMGKCINDYVECPFHHYLFNLKTGENVGGTSYNVPKYEVKIENDALYIQIPDF